jgi:hypothetical protein
VIRRRTRRDHVVTELLPSLGLARERVEDFVAQLRIPLDALDHDALSVFREVVSR